MEAIGGLRACQDRKDVKTLKEKNCDMLTPL